MTAVNEVPRSRVAAAVFHVLDPIPFGFFVGVLIFDVIYARSADILWMKFSAWLVSIGLVFAIVPRLINLFQVWFGTYRSTRAAKLDFWLNVVAIVAALLNAFVHSRDAYAVIPDAVWLSIVTVAAMALGRILMAWQPAGVREPRHG